jgi:hypothetical protein
VIICTPLVSRILIYQLNWNYEGKPGENFQDW